MSRISFLSTKLPGWLAAMCALGFTLPSQAYEIEAVTGGGSIDGMVKLSGAAPPLAPITVTKNQDYCGKTIANPIYEVGKGNGLANVLVYLKEVPKGKAPPADPAELQNDKCMFHPRVQAAMAGQKLKISSDDPVLHNTHPQNMETNVTLYNVALPFKGFSVVKPLPDKPQMLKIKCDAHEWMHAWLMVLDHPYFATTDADGKFSIKDVPPGTYTLVVWHEAAGEKSEPVTVAANQHASAQVELSPK